MRLCGLVLLMFLASVGIGLSGAGPISSGKRGEYLNNEIKTELVQEKAETETEENSQQLNLFK